MNGNKLRNWFVVGGLILALGTSSSAFAGTLKLKVQGAGCDKKTAKAIKAVKGVESVHVKLIDKSKNECEAEVKAKDDVKVDDIVNAVKKEGLTAEVEGQSAPAPAQPAPAPAQ